MDRFHHEMTSQDKVKLCHTILRDEFKGQKTAEWRNYCSSVINSKESLEFIYLLSGFEEPAFSALEQVFLVYEKFEIKDQTSSVSQAKKLLCGAVQQPNIVASMFKCLRFPHFTGREVLQPFISTVKKGKAIAEFMALVERALQAEVAEEDNDRSILSRINGQFYCAISSEDHNVSAVSLEGIPFGGADLIIIQKQKNWSEEKLKSTLRQICGLNTRLKMTHYIIVVRERDESLTQTPEECTLRGMAYTLYVAWSRMSAKAGPGLTDVVKKNCVIIVGTPSKSATNWFVAENELDLMQHIRKLFMPPRGIVLEFGHSYTLGLMMYVYSVAQRFGQKVISGTVVAGHNTLARDLNGTAIEPFLVGDPAYPFCKHLMKDYTGSNLSPEKEYFNYRLNRARIQIERTFGLLKGRWHCLLHPLECDLANVVQHIIASCIMHNIYQEGDVEYLEEWDSGDAEEMNKPPTLGPLSDDVGVGNAQLIKSVLCQYIAEN
ncbi:hypothetical protein AWC38_SpisGene17665 [Stylophora pistillata]|uniref:DDE Tnp4 domain-containing protein n=1 Tax=Stylophora pistillata TaxID=50429 RepID=A0A2B4RMF8_STYPI|nr:hypothetical protein AWC38_SpisGene17665 [Stylophora pistillata]